MIHTADLSLFAEVGLYDSVMIINKKALETFFKIRCEIDEKISVVVVSIDVKKALKIDIS